MHAGKVMVMRNKVKVVRNIVAGLPINFPVALAFIVYTLVADKAGGGRGVLSRSVEDDEGD